MKALLRLHRCAFTLESTMSTYSISTIITRTEICFVIITNVIIDAVNHAYNLSFFSINIKMFCLFLHILLLKKGEDNNFHHRKQILVSFIFES